MDFIRIENLEVFANHGVLQEETNLGQKFIISARLSYSFDEAACDDNLEKAVNYADVCKFIVDYMQNHTFKLIETVADRMAIEILKEFQILREVSITVKKPWAPIGLPIENVMAHVTRKWNDVCLSIGSNMGDKKANLDAAVDMIKNDDCFKEVVVSDYLVTEPYGKTDQDEFLNAAIRCKTVYTPQQLLRSVNNIENEMGRVRQIHWGPRTLDIDILLYENEIINENNLVVPHYDMSNRLFVLEPLAQIAPYFIHPVKRMTINELKEALDKA